MPEKKQNFLIPAVGAALVVTGGVVAYMYFNKGPAGDISGALSSAKVIPDDALMATYISTNPQAWEKLQQFGTPEAQKIVEKELQNFDKQVLSQSNISYEKDLKPWVGGVMVAMLPSSPVKPVQATPAKAAEPNVLIVVGIKDKVSALNFANKLKSEKGVKTQEIDYKGEKITETTGKGKPTYTAVLNDYLVLAQQKQAVEQAIDTAKAGEPSFASKEGAKSVLSKSVDVENTLAQIYLPDYAVAAEQFLASNPQATPLPPQTLAQLKQVKSMVAAVGVDDTGLRMKAIADLDAQAIKYEYQSSPGKVVAQFPADTIAMLSGQGISRGWSALVEQSKNNPGFNQAVNQTRQQLKFVNIDLDKDIFGWMDGEFAVGAIPSNQGLLANLGFGGALVFDTSDRKTAEATFTKLDTLAKTQAINIAQRNIGSTNITEWQTPQGALLAHGWLDNDTVFLALGGPIADTIAAGSKQSLDNSETFKAATSSLQKPNGGYLYVDMNKTMSLVNNFAAAQKQPISPEVSAILNSIRGVGITAISPNKSTSEVEMLLPLKPRQS